MNILRQRRDIRKNDGGIPSDQTSLSSEQNVSGSDDERKIIAKGGHRFDRVAPTQAAVDFECTLTISGRKYDLSSWANAHPGGALVLKRYNGKDATRAFEKVGHSPYAINLSKNFAVDESNSNSPATINPVQGAWKKKIFTKEDPQNIHKCCGLFALLHFTFRFYQMMFGDISAGFGNRNGSGPSFWTMVCLIPHVFLSFSSLMFHSVPKERIVGAPMIWQEFRAHSIIFASRSLVGSVCAWISVSCNHEPLIRNKVVAMNSLTIIATIFSADIATKRLRVSEKESTTATLPYWEGASVTTQRRFKKFYAYSQFLATLACLSMANPCWAFAVLLPIQLAAFLMTMVRKGFISTKTYHFVYAGSLILPYIVALRCVVYSKEPDAVVIFVLGYLIYRLRCLGISKYPLWSSVVALRILFGDKFIAYEIW